MGVKIQSFKRPLRLNVCKGCGATIGRDERYLIMSGDLVHIDDFCLKEYENKKKDHPAR